MDLKEDEKLILIDADCEKLNYSGRIDFCDSKAPQFIFPGSSVTMLFKGSILKILVKNNHSYYDNYLGYILDGVQEKVLLSNEKTVQEIVLANDLIEDKSHEIILFKRQDGCHEFTFYGFIISKEGEVLSPPKKSRRCMEFYGDSAAAGELIEAVDFEKTSVIKHSGEYSNAWYSYAMVTARNLKADVSIIAQAGAALLDNKGYFLAPESMGMETIYDKLHYNPDLGKIIKWNFEKYNPQVVVIDIGQNDAFPEDYMKENEKSEKAETWKCHYKDFVMNIRKKYPYTFIVLTTTIINHHSSWDRAIGEVCMDINDEKIVHFLYSCNGHGTPFYTNMAEAEQMAFELSIFIKGLEKEIWKVQK